MRSASQSGSAGTSDGARSPTTGAATRPMPEPDDGLDEGTQHGGQAQHEQDLPGEIGQGQPRIGPPGRS